MCCNLVTELIVMEIFTRIVMATKTIGMLYDRLLRYITVV